MKKALLAATSVFAVSAFITTSALAATGEVIFINKAETLGKIVRMDDGSNNVYVFRISQDIAAGYYPIVGDDVTFDTGPGRSRKASNVDGSVPKALCFLADTPVWVNGGLAPISKVAPGWTAGKSRSLGQIEALEEHEGRWQYRQITLESGNSISVVDAHRFMIESGQWVAAPSLQSGMRLKSLDGAVAIKSVEIRTMSRIGKVYNMKISGSDQYLVGQDGVVVRDY
ncbi:MAG: hypothetical protein QGG36_01940 [Pirellulaceae bacterium]|jgi:hypothetical protein|nr:hypothetical protein [Pirellulaceae bacterium]